MRKVYGRLLATVLMTSVCVVSWGQTQISNSSAQTDASAAQLKNILERAGERVQKYHDAMFSIAFTEVVQQQELRSDASSKDKPKNFVYESVVVSRQSSTSQQDSFPLVTRTLKSVDGKPTEQKNLSQRSHCVDTNPPSLYADPLIFLLPENQTKFRFSYEGEADLHGRRVAVVSITMPPASAPIEIKDTGKCFSLSRGLQRKGKIWIDVNTFDVLQLQWQLAESFSAKTSTKVVRSGMFFGLRPRREISYEKADTMIRFQPVTFQNPDQILLLPASSESTWIIKGAKIAGYQTTTAYTQYKRFLTGVEIRETNEDRN